MMTVYDYLLGQPVLVLFLVLGLGYLIGSIKVFDISLGAVGGVLLAGLVFGHFGFTMYAGAQTFGFVLFIFCVGFQAGPQFFDVLMTSGLKYLSLALVVATTGFGLAVGLARVLDFAPGLAAGLMGGAMTTTPTLAAAQDAVRSGLVEMPAGYTSEQVLTNIGAGYALTYLFGLIGLILIIRLLPRVLGIDLPAEAAKLESGNDPEAGPDISKITRRTYRVTKSEKLGRSVYEMELAAPRDVSVAGIRRNGEEVPLSYDTRLEIGDEVLVIGRVDHLLAHAPEIGEEIADAKGLSVAMSTAQVVVSNPNVVGHPISEIRLDERIGALPLAVRRQRTEMPFTEELILHRGDVITVFGPDFAIERLVRHVGHVERDVTETDLFTFAIGISAGIGLGTLAITIGGVTIGLGMAGGLLITGLLIGFARSIWPVFGRVPSSARWVLMELGLLMFMAGVGLNSGGGIVEIVQSAGVKLIGAGVLVTLVPVLVGYFFSRKVLNLNPAEALGGVTGSMTSGAALSVVTGAAQSNVPALGYTGAYAFANVILTLAGTLIMLL
ncbi:MAG: TrkA C-terminal domain-containing protein [Halioglobus sp.]